MFNGDHPCYKPTPCRSQVRCCDQCRYGKGPVNCHKFNENPTGDITGMIKLRLFPWTRFQTAYQCTLTELMESENLMMGGIVGPIFLRMIRKNVMGMFVTHAEHVLDIVLDDNNVIIDICNGCDHFRINKKCIPTLKRFVGFQLIFPEKPEEIHIK